MSQTWPTDFQKGVGFPGQKFVSAFRPDFNSMIQTMLTFWLGSSDPPQTYPGMGWCHTGVMEWWQRNTSDTGWNTLWKLDEEYGGLLPKSGGTMVGALNMGGFTITNLGAGTGNAAARVSDLAAYARLDGTVAFTGVPRGPSQDPSASNDLARKLYVDVVAKAGGAFTGQITMPITPTDSQHVTRKQDLDSQIQSHSHTGGLNGAKLEGASALKSTGIPAGYVTRANGSGAVDWGPPPGGTMRTEGSLLATESGSTGWITYNLSTLITAMVPALEQTAQIRGAVLKVDFNAPGSGGGYGFAEFRRSSAATVVERYSGPHKQNFDPETRRIERIAIVPLAPTREFDYRVTRSGGGTFSAQIRFLGVL